MTEHQRKGTTDFDRLVTELEQEAIKQERALYSDRERFLAELGYTQCARLREKVVYAPGGLGSCAVLVERAARILLALLVDVER